MRSFRYVILVVAGITSCTMGLNLKNVDLGSTIHDNNSKVWMVNKVVIKDINTAPSNDYQKDVMIFYESGIVNVSPLRKLGDDSPRRGKYYLNSQKRYMTIEFDDKEIWEVDIDYATQDSIYLIRTNDEDGPIGIQIIPLPAL